MASSTDQCHDLKLCCDLRCLHLASRPQIGVATSDSSLNVPFLSATLPFSQRLLLAALVFMVATSLSCRDLA